MNLGFERTEQKEDWITPPSIPKSLGHFDIDPCASHFQKEFYADKNLFIEDDGLNREWLGRVWCNPPYGRKAEKFIKKLSEHGNGVALIFARMETKTWQDYILPKATAVLFLNKRIAFWKDGVEGKETGGCGSALVAYGEYNAQLLLKTGLGGYFIRLHGETIQ